MADPDATAALAELVHALGEADSVPDVTAALARFAVDHLGADLAFVTLRDEGGRLVRPEFHSGQEGFGALDHGPVTIALSHHAVLTIEDTTTDRTWPDWCGTAAAQGVRSLRRIGMARLGAWTPSLDLLSLRPRAFGELEESLWAADHTSLALHLIERIANLGEALESRAIIAQAQGLLMERHGLTSDRAMSYLRRRSQEEQVKLREVATELVQEWERTAHGQGALREEHPPGDRS